MCIGPNEQNFRKAPFHMGPDLEKFTRGKIRGKIGKKSRQKVDATRSFLMAENYSAMLYHDHTTCNLSKNDEKQLFLHPQPAKTECFFSDGKSGEKCE